MASQVAKTVLTLGAQEVKSLKNGVNFKTNVEDGKSYIVYKYEDGLRVCRNQCKHQGGLFIKDIEDINSR